MSIESLVLDSQGPSSWIDRDRKVMRLLEQPERDTADLAISAVATRLLASASITSRLDQPREPEILRDSDVLQSSLVADGQG
ncbi:hypothetical protein [Paractinoplanes hotanensis]|uniref:Uncharacterized protein n=1 Tax=Paractinoplanes hotanensis TaxID=2906497 RepID=A0ABT0YE30_9ACTN|nr:hypothetical protein [Actinoplanes hotanensis]MCM4084060.1 hypothetical protein [Actinoplanes hotanensis]